MGQKVNPIGFRLGVHQKWLSNWYSDKNQREFVAQDAMIRNFLEKKLSHAGLAKVEIERSGKEKKGENLKVTVYVSRPGVVIGRKGEDADKLKNKIKKLVKQDLVFDIKEVKRPETNAKIIAITVAKQIEKRFSFRRVMKKAIQNAIRSNVTGCKIMVSGRLNGAEMARTEWIKEGQVSLHTIKNKIDYATHEAKTTYGITGVKVWVYQENLQNKQ